MISAVSWIPKGASNPAPAVVDPPSKEELEELLKTAVLGSTSDADPASDAADADAGDDDETMDLDDESPSSSSAAAGDGVSHARAVAEALNEGSRVVDITDGIRELDMDHYDDEDGGIEIFGKSDTYYPSNDMDPYLKKTGVEEDEDDDDDEIEDLTIKPTDSVIVCARNEDDVSELEVWILEEMVDGELNMYVHHAIMLSAFPLCTAWLDCNLKSGDKGNFIAVGSMEETAIEIWDLDLLEEVQPFMVLGGKSKKKKKDKKASAKYKKGSHRDSVLGLAWNKEVRNVLASASADATVKVWDMATGKCVVTAEHHTNKVQAVDWSRHSPEVLLSGSFDQSVLMMDMRSSKPTRRWSVTADVESLLWDPHNKDSFVVSLEDGTIQGFDVRVATNSTSGSKPSFTLHAHDKAVSCVSYNPSAPNFLATGSTDKMVKLWDLSNNQPSRVASRNPKAGAVFSISFSEESPFLLAIGGSKGRLEVWDTITDPGVERCFGKLSNRKTDLTPSA